MYTISEAQVKKFEDVSSIERYIHDNLITRQHRLGFRGHANATWGLETTLVRYVDEAMSMFPERKESFENTYEVAEAILHRDFKRKLITNSDLPQEQVDKIDIWQYGQHFGLPSPLLDWSYSPYIALYFALVDRPRSKAEEPCAIWVINLEILEMMNRIIVDDIRPKYADKISPTEYLNKLYPALDIVDEPYEGNKRIEFQQGFFTKLDYYRSIEIWIKKIGRDLPQPKADRIFLQKLEFPCGQRDSMKLLDKLDKMNINGRTLFPDIFGTVKDTIDSTSRWFQTPKYKTFYFSH
ncbi:FRG domain-containing protein [Microbulbifer sp.]|uniref:FRG domain-containing protein n=1 Tax=Microbulbifer sp. TaxID=1908541 RepID=UPI003F37CB53